MEVTLREIEKIMEKHFPLHLADDWDNSGLQIGDPGSPISHILIGLDMSEDLLKDALDHRVDMIITHHPFLFQSLKSIRLDSSQGRIIQGLIQGGINLYAAHTNLDRAERGMNQMLAERLELENIGLLDRSHSDDLYKLAVYVPPEHEERVREAICQAGGGMMGNYSDCCFRSSGIGCFRPLDGSHPFIGETGRLEEVEEIRLETIIPADRLNLVVSNMLMAHPYEEVAYDLYRLYNGGKNYSYGRIGMLPELMSLQDFCGWVKRCYGLAHVRFTGDLGRRVRKVALVAGSGSSYIAAACAQDCDVLLTGDLKYHEALEAEARELAVVDAGHEGTERLIVDYLRQLLQDELIRGGYSTAVSAFHREKECMRII
ncbi:MAG: Nif3-like dinuclear metal center hexameric protein [Syntrophomonadaceae bacterium]|nr:Nif3-like dinuclear metal center hexameric protein [Syntrophomonadaceae bacterium]